MTNDQPAATGGLALFRRDAPRCWVRRYLPEEDAFLLAQLDQNGSTLVATVDKASPNRARMRDTLIDSVLGTRRSLAPLRLLVREAAVSTLPSDSKARRFSITDVIADRMFRDADARKILDAEGQVISRWSDDLEDAVNHQGRLCLAHRAIDFFAEMHSTEFARVRAGVAEKLTPETDLPRDLFGALQGGELPRPQRYNPGVPLELQLESTPHPSQRANYALQRALVDDFVAQTTRSGTSALAEAQSTLVGDGVLLAIHPARSPELLCLATQEVARGIAAQILAGLMDLQGVPPATRDFDELWAPQLDGSLARRPTLHQEIVAEMAPHPVGRSPNLREKTDAYLSLAASRLTRYEAEARVQVYQEQMKTAGGRKPRHPTIEATGTPSENEPATPSVPAAAPRALAVLQSSSPAAHALDHATQTASQAENIPWF